MLISHSIGVNRKQQTGSLHVGATARRKIPLNTIILLFVTSSERHACSIHEFVLFLCVMDSESVLQLRQIAVPGFRLNDCANKTREQHETFVMSMHYRIIY